MVEQINRMDPDVAPATMRPDRAETSRQALERARDIVRWRDVDGWSLAEIADTLEVSITSVQAVISRARKTVRQANETQT